MTIDGQNNLHMCNTHTVEETNFAKFFDLRGSARETLEEEEREREKKKKKNSNVKHTKSLVLKGKKNWN